MKTIKLRKNMPSKMFNSSVCNASTCHIGSGSCNCGAGCLAPQLAKQVILNTKAAY